MGRWGEYRTGRLTGAFVALAVIASFGVITAGAAPAAALAPECGVPVVSGDEATVTCNFTDAAQQWTVPAGVTSATFDVYGAQGHGFPVDGFNGGLGGRSTATLAVTPGEVLEVYVGGTSGFEESTFGDDLPTGGFNGGGDPGSFCIFTSTGPFCGRSGFGGGGASDVRRSPYGLGGRLIVAGGGGGNGSQSVPGDGGGLVGGSAVLAGETEGRTAGTGGNQDGSSGSGVLGQGSQASTITDFVTGGFDGGGGGGGYYGGAGGFGASGGGGSGFTPDGTGMTNGVREGTGLVVITYAVPTAPAAPAFTASTPPATATVGTAYSYTFTATGNPAPTFTVATGTLPAGLTLTTAGVLSGTPTTPGDSTFTVQAANGVLPNAITPNRTITVSPAPAAPAFTASTPPATATVGTAYSYTFTATGNPAPTFTVATGTLPAGLTLTTAGVLSGTPTTPGDSTFTVQAANGVLPNAVTPSRTITVSPAPAAPAFTASTPPATATVGTAYSYTFTATGNPAPTFTVATGTLPAGLTLTTAGVLSGTPTTAETSTFTVQAANGVLPNAVTPSRTITVSPAPAAPAFTASTPPATAMVGTAYSYTFTATGNPAPTFTVATGTLPAGLTLTTAGVLSGTPTTPGDSTFTVQAANGVLPNAITPNRTITVVKADQTINFAPPGSHTPGDAPFTVSATASSGLPVSFSVPIGGPCTISGSTVTILGVGTCSITASQAGNANYNAAPAVTRDVAIGKASPTISGQASAGGPLGTSVNDVATVAGGSSPTGTVTFRLFTTNSCANQVFTSTNNLVGATSTSGTFTPAAFGTYYWSAVYNGDANNNPATATCIAPNQAVTITKATPTLSGQASAGGLLGTPVRDVATLAGGSSPTGTVTFRLFADNTCGTEVFTSTNALSGLTATSSWFTPTAAGTYWWTAVYNGDANNETASSACQAPNQSVVITPFQAPAFTRTVVGDLAGPLTVNAGESVGIAGARVVGPITVKPGGALTVVNSSISRGIVADAPSFFSLCGSDVAGPPPAIALSVSNATVPVQVGDPAAGCARNRFAGQVRLISNLAVTFGANEVSHSATIDTNGPGGTVIKANTFYATLTCTGNSPGPTNNGQPNTAATKTGQCVSL